MQHAHLAIGSDTVLTVQLAMPSQTAYRNTNVYSLLGNSVGGALGKAMRYGQNLCDGTDMDDLTLPPNGLNPWKDAENAPKGESKPKEGNKVTHSTGLPLMDAALAIKRGPVFQAGLSLTGEVPSEAENNSFNLLDDLTEDSRISTNKEETGELAHTQAHPSNLSLNTCNWKCRNRGTSLRNRPRKDKDLKL